MQTKEIKLIDIYKAIELIKEELVFINTKLQNYNCKFQDNISELDSICNYPSRVQ